ncbi:MAG: FliI/YscN family ATPase [Planctomycetia bacterium]|nr:FliI/YscN family ATPase [Planctomycetia bacterium]
MNPLSLLNQLDTIIPTAITGTVQETAGTTVLVSGFPAPVGALAEIRLRDRSVLPAEVIGFHDKTAVLYPLQSTHGIRHGDRVHLVQTAPWLTVGEGMLGKVLDARGRVMETSGSVSSSTYGSMYNSTYNSAYNSTYGTASNSAYRTGSGNGNASTPVRKNGSVLREAPTNDAILNTERIPFHREAPKVFERPRITTPISTGVRAIDAVLTLGEGQRVGIFAGSGVGKSTLLGMIARYSNADVIVIGLVGERGREVNDFLERDLGPEGQKRSVVVVATSDEPAILRVRAAQTVTAVAEYFRDQGKNVLLLMDSLTRFAMAQREIGLAAGEPPTRNGYPPSVFAMLPALVERTGRTRTGNITAMYTVLVEGDDENEPIADTVRGLLDGHIWLSRKLASAGHYPAIDIPSSISRLMNDICERDHVQTAQELRAMISLWREFQDLIAINAYKRGTNPALDVALEKKKAITYFLRQNTDEPSTLEKAVTEMMEIIRR